MTKPTPTRTEDFQMEDLVNDDSVNKYFANAVQTQLTLADGCLIFRSYNKVHCIVTMPLPLIKSLQQNLTTVIAEYEKNLGEEVKTIDQLAAIMQGKSGDVK